MGGRMGDKNGINKGEINERFKCQLKCVITQWSAVFLEKQSVLS